MTMRLALILAATALASASALAQEPAAPNEAVPSQAPAPELKALAESCAAHKFETTVMQTVDGKERGSKVKLCGQEGQTDADWAKTLKDAVRKVEANDKMLQSVKDQIVTALKAEIITIEAGTAVASTPPAPIARPAERPPEYAVYPPLPKAPAPPATQLSESSNLPSSPGSRAAAASSPMKVLTPAAAKPRLTIRCLKLGEPGAGSPCISLERNTVLTIRADEELAGGAGLRFLRRGDIRGEIALAQMRQGQSLRSKLPPKLCAGVLTSKVEIQILGGKQVVDTFGPYELRC